MLKEDPSYHVLETSERNVTTALPVLFLLERLPDCFVWCSPPGLQKRFPVTGHKRFGKSEVRERFAPCSWWEEPMKSQSRYLLKALRHWTVELFHSCLLSPFLFLPGTSPVLCLWAASR